MREVGRQLLVYGAGSKLRNLQRMRDGARHRRRLRDGVQLDKPASIAKSAIRPRRRFRREPRLADAARPCDGDEARGAKHANHGLQLSRSAHERAEEARKRAPDGLASGRRLRQLGLTAREPCCDLRAFVETELVQDLLDVPFGGAFGDEEALRYLAVREPLRHEAGDLAFPAGQLGRGCHDPNLAPGDPRLQKHVRREVAEQGDHPSGVAEPHRQLLHGAAQRLLTDSPGSRPRRAADFTLLT